MKKKISTKDKKYFYNNYVPFPYRSKAYTEERFKFFMKKQLVHVIIWIGLTSLSIITALTRNEKTGLIIIYLLLIYYILAILLTTKEENKLFLKYFEIKRVK